MPTSAENRKARHLRARALARWARGVFRSWVERARGGEYVFLLFTAALIGLLGGLSAIAFNAVIHLFQSGFWNVVEPRLADLREIAAWKIALVPAAGGLIVGLITTFLVSEAKGHGVPQVIKAVALSGGKIRGRVALAKMLASAITIGSGGSAGREGPVIQIGAAIGRKLRVRIVHEAVAETPATRAAKARSDEQAAAERGIADDPIIQDMQRQFGAQIIPDSIRPAGKPA